MRLKPVIFFLVVGSIAGYFVYMEARYGTAGTVKVGDLAPEFTVKDENGKVAKLSDYRGKLVFLNFWWTGCIPCITEMPEMELVHNLFKDRNFAMLAVSVDVDWESVKKFYEDHSLTLPKFPDPGHRVTSLYKVYRYPETFLIDPEGRVLKHYVGAERWTNPRVLSYIESLIPDDTISAHPTSQRD